MLNSIFQSNCFHPSSPNKRRPGWIQYPNENMYKTLNYVTTANIMQQFPMKHASFLPYFIEPHPLLEDNNIMKPQRSMQLYEENWMFSTYAKSALHYLTNLPVLEAKLQSVKKPWIFRTMLKLNSSAWGHCHIKYMLHVVMARSYRCIRIYDPTHTPLPSFPCTFIMIQIFLGFEAAQFFNWTN
jgi:hypothetical protein